MEKFRLVLRGLFRKGSLDLVKILCLALGLALGLVLVAKVVFERSFDTFYPDSERIFNVTMMGNDGYAFPRLSGGVAPYMMQELPGIEAATRYNNGYNTKIAITGSSDFIDVDMIYADSVFFDVLPRPMIVGDANGLREPGHTLISKSLAEKLGGVEKAMDNVILTADSAKLYIKGVFEDVPANSSIRYDIVTSIYSQDKGYIENWTGAEHFFTYFKLKDGVDPSDLDENMLRILKEHVDNEMLKRNPYTYHLTPIVRLHTSDESMRNVYNVMLLIAVVVLVLTTFNYVLLVVSTMINRSKTTAVEKCFGASSSDILKSTLAETVIHLLLALGTAAVMLYVFREYVDSLLGTPLENLVIWQTVAVTIGICAIVLVVAASLPVWMYTQVPVAQAFRGIKESRRGWKLALLFMEFACIGCLISVLAGMGKQYMGMVNYDVGFDREKVVSVNWVFDRSVRDGMIRDISALPQVEGVGISSCTILTGSSGELDVTLPDKDDVLMKISDIDKTDENYPEVMGLRIIEGKTFDKRNTESNERKVLVSRSFADRWRNIAGNKGSVVGEKICVQSHSDNSGDAFTISGVFDDMMIGSLKSLNGNPLAIFCGNPANGYKGANNIIIRVSEVTPELMASLRGIVDKWQPDGNIDIRSSFEIIDGRYEEERKLRDSLGVCAILALMISVAGLLGYAVDEVNRRRKEIAICKVNGATSYNVVMIVARDISLVSVPALILGIIAGHVLVGKWLTNFAITFPLSWWQHALVFIILYTLIIVCVAWQTHRNSMINPSEVLKQE